MMIKISRRTALAALGTFVATPGQSSTPWPDRPVTIVIGVAPGGTTDAIARIVGEEMSTRLGRQVLIESRPGASGVVAAGYVARAAADGYTLLAMSGTHATTAAVYRFPIG
jgi:tripartite-type tricarboxylate transporter receptor subunit TctC